MSKYQDLGAVSAYALALEHGFQGSEEEWLESLHGRDGQDGIDGAPGRDGVEGKDGTNGLDGKTPVKGVDYTDGRDGKNGVTPHIGDNGNWWIGDVDTGIAARGVGLPPVTDEDEGKVAGVVDGEWGLVDKQEIAEQAAALIDGALLPLLGSGEVTA